MRTVEFIPVFGIILFGVLYFYSSTLYPGGSQANINSIGFDWYNNYWCDLMNENGMNEQPNPASRLAISAMVILCVSLIVFFIQFALYFAKNRFWKNVIGIFGTISMIFAILTFTRYHNIMIALSSFFGLFVLIGIILEVYNSRFTALKMGGILCIFLLILNNYIYYSRQFVEILPLLQKITFAIVLIWFMALDLHLIRSRRN